MKKALGLLAFTLMGMVSGQQLSFNNFPPFLTTVTDAKAAGQGDIGVASAPDVFSQRWNPSKYVFADRKRAFGLTHIPLRKSDFAGFSQANLSFYNRLDDRRAYAMSIHFFGYDTQQTAIFSDNFQGNQKAYELAIDASYIMKLSNRFSMGVSGRFLSLRGTGFQREPSLLSDAASLYGVDVSAFYSGNEIAYSKFNGLWRAGMHLYNLRGKLPENPDSVEKNIPTLLKVGAGFDFIFNQDHTLAINTEFKTALNTNMSNPNTVSQKGAILALGSEYAIKEQLFLRTGYSYGIQRATDRFLALGAGLGSKDYIFDIAFILANQSEENPIRSKFRFSISIEL